MACEDNTDTVTVQFDQILIYILLMYMYAEVSKFAFIKRFKTIMRPDTYIRLMQR